MTLSTDIDFIHTLENVTNWHYIESEERSVLHGVAFCPRGALCPFPQMCVTGHVLSRHAHAVRHDFDK